MDANSGRITHKLWLGMLPSAEPVKVWGGMGSGKACDGCDEAIPATEAEHELDFADGRVLHFHVACAGLWQVLKQALPKS